MNRKTLASLLAAAALGLTACSGGTAPREADPQAALDSLVAAAAALEEADSFVRETQLDIRILQPDDTTVDMMTIQTYSIMKDGGNTGSTEALTDLLGSRQSEVTYTQNGNIYWQIGSRQYLQLQRSQVSGLTTDNVGLIPERFAARIPQVQEELSVTQAQQTQEGLAVTLTLPETAVGPLAQEILLETAMGTQEDQAAMREYILEQYHRAVEQQGIQEQYTEVDLEQMADDELEAMRSQYQSMLDATDFGALTYEVLIDPAGSLASQTLILPVTYQGQDCQITFSSRRSRVNEDVEDELVMPVFSESNTMTQEEYQLEQMISQYMSYGLSREQAESVINGEADFYELMVANMEALEQAQSAGEEGAASDGSTAAAGEENTASGDGEAVSAGGESAASGGSTAASGEENASAGGEGAASGSGEDASAGEKSAASGGSTAASGEENASAGGEGAASGSGEDASAEGNAASGGESAGTSAEEALSDETPAA